MNFQKGKSIPSQNTKRINGLRSVSKIEKRRKIEDHSVKVKDLFDICLVKEKKGAFSHFVNILHDKLS